MTEKIKNDWRSAMNLIRAVYNAVVKPTIDAFAAIFRWLSENIVKPLLTAMGNQWRVFADGMRFIKDHVIRPTFDAVADGLRWLRDHIFRPILQWIGDRWSDMGRGIRFIADSVIHPVFDGLKQGLEFVKNAFRAAVDGIGKIWDGLRAAAAKPVKFVIDSVWNNGILKAWNLIADFLPVKKVDEFKPAWLGGYATGGVLPGYTPGRDVHEFVSPTGGRLHLSGGEAIMRPEWTQAVGGPAAVEAMNNAARSGRTYDSLPASLQGSVPNPEGSHTVDSGNLARAIHDSQLHAYASGGVYIPNERERAQLGGAAINTSLWQAAKTAFPGATLNSAMTDHSNDGGYHPRGAAVDLGGPMQQIANWIFSKWPKTAQLIYGPGPLALWGRTGHIEPSNQAGIRAAYGEATMAGHYDHVHWASDGVITSDGKMVSADVGSGGSAGGFLSWVANKARELWDKWVEPLKQAISAKTRELGGKLFTQIPMGFYDKVKDAAWNKLSEHFGTSSGGSSSVDLSGVNGSVVEKVREVFSRHGWSGQQWEDAKWIINKESGFNTSATNPSSGAFGLFQFNPMGGNTLGAYLPTRSTDPVIQADAGARYIKDRYGDPSAARRFWEANGWYASGGVLPGNLALFDSGGMLEPDMVATNKTNKPEPVFTHDQWAVIRQNIMGRAQAQDWVGMFQEMKTAAGIFSAGVADFTAWVKKGNPNLTKTTRVVTPQEFGNQFAYNAAVGQIEDVASVLGLQAQGADVLALAGVRNPNMPESGIISTVDPSQAAEDLTGGATKPVATAQVKTTSVKKHSGGVTNVFNIHVANVDEGMRRAEMTARQLAAGMTRMR